MAENQSAEALRLDLAPETDDGAGTDWARYEAAKRQMTETENPQTFLEYETGIGRILKELNL